MNKIIQSFHCVYTLTLQKPKEIGLLVLLILFAIMAIYKSTPARVDKVFELKISKNGSVISNVFQERQITQTKTVWVDTLMLKSGSQLQHKKLGAIGFSDTYFIDVESEFTVKKPGVYYFIAGSDDGFALEINGKPLCSFAKDRPYATQRCRIELSEGKNHFKMMYFQGGGHAGMTLAYQFKGDAKRRWMGEDSQYLKF